MKRKGSALTNATNLQYESGQENMIGSQPEISEIIRTR